MPIDRPRVLVTGSAGLVGQLIVPSLRTHYRLRLVDLLPQNPVDDDEVLLADATDIDAMIEACSEVKAVVHLAGHPLDADFSSVLLPRNIEATWSIFQAAAKSDVECVVYASTVQVLTGSPRRRLRVDQPPTPISVYATTKLFGEGLAWFHSEQGHFRAASLRLGWVAPQDTPLARTERVFPTLWCGPEDLSSLVRAAIGSNVQHATVFAVSPPATSYFDVSNPYGWRPAQVPQLLSTLRHFKTRLGGLSARARRR